MVDFTLVPVLFPVFIGFGIGLFSKDIGLAVLSGYTMLGYVGVRSESTLLLATFMLVSLFAAFATAKMIAGPMVGGD